MNKQSQRFEATDKDGKQVSVSAKSKTKATQVAFKLGLTLIG